jgi:DNA-binding response OmpR family regulator
MASSICIKSNKGYLKEALESLGIFKVMQDADLCIVDSKGYVSIGSDRLSKPISLLNLVEVVQKHIASGDIKMQDAVLQVKLRKIKCKEKEVALTEKETSLLLFLKKNRATKEQLLKHVWQSNEDVETNTFETHLYRLRQKLSECELGDVIEKKGDYYSLKE